MRTSYEVGRDQQRLKVALILNTLVILVEIVGGTSANNLGFISDAIHNFLDEAALLLTFYAYSQASRETSGRRISGYNRMEVMTAWINLSTLILVTLHVMTTAIYRLVYPLGVQGDVMWIAGLIASVGNLGVALVLWKSAQENMNIQGV